MGGSRNGLLSVRGEDLDSTNADLLSIGPWSRTEMKAYELEVVVTPFLFRLQCVTSFVCNTICLRASFRHTKVRTLETRSWYDGNFVVTDDTIDCQTNNLRCRQWRQSWHLNKIQFLAFEIVTNRAQRQFAHDTAALLPWHVQTGFVVQ